MTDSKDFPAKLEATFKDITVKFQNGLARGTTKAAMMLQGSVRRKIMKSPKNEDGVSSPGNPPANQTGNLQRSVHVTAAESGPNPQAVVTVEAEYGLTLEYGNKKGTLLPRPFFKPSIEELKDAMAKVIAEEASKL